MRVLAIDQGTSATKAVVFGDDGETLASVEVAVTPRAVPGGGVEQDPEQLWDSVCAAGRDAIARAGGSVTRRRLRQPGRDRAGLGPGHRPSPEQRHLLAGSAGRDDLCRPGAARRAADPHDRAAARPLLRGTEDDVAAPSRHGRRGRDHQRCLARAPPHGRVRHRRHHRLEDDAPRPRAARLVGGGLRGLRPRRGGPASRRRQRTGDRAHRRVRPVARAERFERRPAGGAGRGALPRAGRIEVHLRDRCLPARQRGRTAVHVVRRLGRVGGLATRRGRRLLHRRSGLRRRGGRRLAVSLGVPRSRRGSRPRRGLRARRRRRHGGAGPQRARRAVVAAGRAGQHRGDRSGDGAGPRGAGDRRGVGGAGDPVGPCHRDRPRPPARPAAGGRRADPLAGAHADAGGPAPGPGGGRVLPARHRGRCGGPGPARCRRRPGARRRDPAGPRATPATSRRSPPTEAEERLGRVERAVARLVGGPEPAR